MAATNEFMHHLSMAACEWFLMFLMYVEAAFGFILIKFAHQCELQTPCLFCFRFDRVFGDEKSDYYLSHFCNKHRTEVSCLISCNLHHKLSDVKEMCDDCFMSTMKQNQLYPKPLLNKNLIRVPSSTGSCSCCKKQWKPKPRSQIKLRVPKVTMKPSLPLITGRAGGPYRRRKIFKKARDKISGTSTPCHFENDNNNNIHVNVETDTLSDSGCVNRKFNSCSGSDSGDSFYEIECENEGLKDFSRVIIHKVERSRSVISNLETSLTNGIHNKSVIISPTSLASNGSIGYEVKENGSIGLHDVKENGSLEVSQETRSFNEDLHSNDDHKISNSLDKHDGNDDYESPTTHSVGEIKGENEMEKDHKTSNSLDKHDAFESPTTHSVGESEMEKLKQQMENDQEQLRLLHMELEEERNAAAIAADEAMAMITRLQEEKSALHMEALQYLRMMDEQAEYDMEALDKANDLVTEKDKEIQDLEAELEYFRSQYDDNLIMENDTVGKTDDFKENLLGNGKIRFLSFNDSKFTNNNPVLDLEDEKNQILQSISELEGKFHLFSNDNNGDSDKPLQQNETDLVTVENEISDLNDWLEAVESDRDFLEHACNTVQTHVGLEFIQEIARHLHDLRSVRFDRRCQNVD